MARLPKSIIELSKVEKFEMKGFTYLGETKNIELIAKDGREYLIFADDEKAKAHATDVYISHQDDPEVHRQLGLLGKSMKTYASARVDKDGVRSVLSYDQHHQVKLNGNAIAFRII